MTIEQLTDKSHLEITTNPIKCYIHINHFRYNIKICFSDKNLDERLDSLMPLNFINDIKQKYGKCVGISMILDYLDEHNLRKIQNKIKVTDDRASIMITIYNNDNRRLNIRNPSENENLIKMNYYKFDSMGKRYANITSLVENMEDIADNIDLINE